MDSNDISWKIIDTMFKDNPNMIVKHHIDSYNQFFSTGLRDVFKNNNPLRFFKELDKETNQYKLNVNYILVVLILIKYIMENQLFMMIMMVKNENIICIQMKRD